MLRLLLILLFFCTNYSYSQLFKKKQILSSAQYFNSIKNYDEAANYYEKYISIKPRDNNVLVNFSEVLIHQNKLLKADSILNIVTQTSRNNKTLFSAYLLLGSIHKKLTQYEKAKTYFNRSLEHILSRNKSTELKAIRELASIDWAIKHQKDSVPLKKIEFPFSSYTATVHSISDSFIIATLYDFSSINKIKVTPDETYNELILSQNDNDFIRGNGAYSNDKKYFYFSRCSKNLNCLLMVATYKNNKIVSIDTVKSDFFDFDYSYSMPSFGIVNEKKMLFFCSNKTHGKGGLDIYVGELKSPQSLTNIKSIPAINSIEDEISPIYDSQEKRLYFSSTWYDNFGGKDVFYSQVNGNLFSKPENLGKPINSSFDEISIARLDSIYFISTNRSASSIKGECCNKIISYKKNLPPSITIEIDSSEVKEINTTIEFENIKSKLPLTLYFHNDMPNPKSLDTMSNSTYFETYSLYLDLLPTYKEKYSNGLDSIQKIIAEEEMIRFFDLKVKKGYNDLNEILLILENELKKGEHIELVIKGFASPLAKSRYNNHLSKRRIAAFKNQILHYNRGILKQYVQNEESKFGKLTFKECPFGEEKSEKYVSDNPNDTKKSIFSIQAALERKIEIIDIVKIKD